MEKFRTRIFAASDLTVTGALTVSGATTNSGAETMTGRLNIAGGSLVLPYSGSPTAFTTAGGIAGGSVGGAFKLYLRGAGTTYILSMPTVASGGTITVTSV